MPNWQIFWLATTGMWQNWKRLGTSFSKATATYREKQYVLLLTPREDADWSSCGFTCRMNNMEIQLPCILEHDCTPGRCLRKISSCFWRRGDSTLLIPLSQWCNWICSRVSHLLFRVGSSCLKPWIQDWHRLTHNMIFFPQSRVARRWCQSEKCQSKSILRYNKLSDFWSRESFWPIITNRSAHCWPSETPSMMFFACKTSYKLHQNATQKTEITDCQKHSLGQWFPLAKLKVNRICSFPKFPKKVIWFWHWHTEACSKITYDSAPRIE